MRLGSFKRGSKNRDKPDRARLPQVSINNVSAVFFWVWLYSSHSQKQREREPEGWQANCKDGDKAERSEGRSPSKCQKNSEGIRAVAFLALASFGAILAEPASPKTFFPSVPQKRGRWGR